MLPLFTWLGRYVLGATLSRAAKDVVDTTVKTVGPEIKEQVTNAVSDDPIRSDNDVQLARQWSAPTHNTWFDVIVDAAARLPRPIMAFWVMGLLFGWLPPPHLENMDPHLLLWIEYIMGFYFGHRAMSRDIPMLVRSIAGAIKN